jgi:hypothetical protein
MERESAFENYQMPTVRKGDVIWWLPKEWANIGLFSIERIFI